MMETGRHSLHEVFPRRFDVPACVVLSALLLGFGLFLPVLTLQRWILGGDTFSVLSGIGSLYREGHILLAVIITAFSVVLPTGKLALLLGVWFCRCTARMRGNLLRWLDFLGKWSMLDVFIVAMIIVMVKMGSWMSAQPRTGIYVFGASVLLSMIATARISRLSLKAVNAFH